MKYGIPCSECKRMTLSGNGVVWGGRFECTKCHEKGMEDVRRELEQSLYRDGIIEDPDVDGGLLG